MATPVEILVNAQNRAGAAFGQLDGQLARVEQHSAKYARTTADMGRASARAATEERDLARALDAVTTSGKAAGGQSEFVAKAMDDIRRKAAAASGEVAKSSQGLDGVGRAATTSASGFKLLAAGVGAFAAAGAGQILIGMASDAVRLGGTLSDLSAKSHISVEGLQRLSHGAEQSGSSVEALAKASVQLSRRLTEGKDGTAAALERLNLTFADLRGLKPEQQLELVSSRFAHVADESEQASVAIGLFGRTGEELIPALSSDLKAAGDEARRFGLILSEDDVAALDRVGDAMDRLKTKSTITMGELIAGAESSARAFADLQDKVLGAISYVPRSIAEALSPGEQGIFAPTPDGLPLRRSPQASINAGAGAIAVDTKEANAELGRRLKGSQDLAKASRELAADLDKEAESQRKLVEGQRKGYDQVDRATLTIFPKHLEFLRREAEELRAGTDELVGRIQVENVRLATIADPRRAVLATLDPKKARGKSADATPEIFGLDNLFSGSNLAGLISGAFQGGGNLTGISSGVSAAAFGSLSKDVFGLASDSFLGTLLPGIGAALGPLLSKGLSALGGVFTGGEEARDVNPARDKFFSGFGGRGTGEGSGFATVAARLTEATGEAGGGQLFKDLVSASNMKDYEAAVRAVEQALKDAGKATKDLAAMTETDFDAMRAGAEKYGISLDALGGKFQANRINDAAQDIVDTFNLLVDGGADAGGVLVGLQDEIAALVADAIKNKVPLAESFRPLVEELIRAKRLTGEGGAALEGLADLQFSDGPVRSFEAITKAAKDAKDAAEAAERAFRGSGGVVTPGGPISTSPGERGPSVEGGAAAGVYANRPGLVLFGEGGEAEVGGPRSFFRQIFDDLGLGDRSGMAAATAAPAPVPVSQTHITIHALDASSFLSFLANGGGATLVQAIRDNVGQVRTNMNRALAAQT